jgi:hypothetical protein
MKNTHSQPIHLSSDHVQDPILGHPQAFRENNRFLLETAPKMLSRNYLDDGLFYLKYGDRKGDQILVDNDFNITEIIDWEWAQTDSKSTAFSSPIVLLSVADF